VPTTARPPPVAATSLRSAKPAWHRAARPGATPTEIRQRILLFVVGGMTYSEVREAYQLSSALGKDIFIGKIGMEFDPNIISKRCFRLDTYFDTTRLP
jgi:syntaxin-binding protein 1